MATRILSVVATALLAVSATSLAQTHAHDVVVAPSTGTEAATARWKADPALREGMGRIRREVLGLEHYQHGHIGPQQAVVLAGDIERDVGFVVSHCKLAPKADAALHPILAELMRGAQAIQSDPADVAAIAPMRLALQRYPALFDDPDWQIGAE
ncbi:DnrO protein [Cognatiluteimonas profundi]|uniref:DnrO protein n=1 Tax=Cognatiluteimonas profundi TaxID=2594501 RepID=UPI00131DA713|nr:DnrO protein [Lysobacter profundi]